MTGSDVAALPDGQELDVLVAGKNGKENKDNSAVQRKKLGMKDDRLIDRKQKGHGNETQSFQNRTNTSKAALMGEAGRR